MTHWNTSPVICSRSPKDEVVVVLVERGRQTLLAGAERLMASIPVGTKEPVTSIFTCSRMYFQVLTQHVAATNNITRFKGSVHIVAPLVAMSTSLSEKPTHVELME